MTDAPRGPARRRVESSGGASPPVDHPTDPFDAAVDQIDRLARSARAGSRTPNETADAVVAAVRDLVDADDLAASEDLELLVAYAIEVAEHDLSAAFRDEAIAEYVRAQLDLAVDRPRLRVELDQRLAGLEISIELGRADAREDLRDLCRNGMATAGCLLASEDRASLVIDLARAVGDVEALVLAIRPEGTIGSRTWPAVACAERCSTHSHTSARTPRTPTEPRRRDEA